MARQHAVVEHPAQVVARRAMAEVAGLRDVARGRVRIRRRILADDRHAVAHHARTVVAATLTAGARHDHLGIVVIRERRRERRRRVTRIAFRGDARMPGGARIGRRADRNGAVVARGATSRDTRMIERPVRIELHEGGRRVAVAALLRGDDVVRRLAGGGNAVVTRAARAEHFRVVDEARDVEAQRRMAGLTGVARRDVRARLREDRRVDARPRMTLHTIVREAAMKVVRRGTRSALGLGFSVASSSATTRPIARGLENPPALTTSWTV